MKAVIDEQTVSNYNSLSEEYRQSWSKTNEGLWNPLGEEFESKTVVRSRDMAINAFIKYTEYFESLLNWEPTSDTLVLVPCGSSKPIGSSTIHKKKLQAIKEGGLESSDVVVLSEPCVIVPEEYRLSLPAVNYDFPPEFTVKNEYPIIFNVFADRLANWLNTMEYDTIYPYLISGHQSKFDAACQKLKYDPDIHTIPTASYNEESKSYSGDRFKTTEQMITKVKAVRKFKAGQSNIDIPYESNKFYQEKFSE